MLALHVAALHGHYQCTRELAHAKEDEDEVAVYINTLDNDQRSYAKEAIVFGCCMLTSCLQRASRSGSVWTGGLHYDATQPWRAVRHT
jgi:hypothetical protein